MSVTNQTGTADSVERNDKPPGLEQLIALTDLITPMAVRVAATLRLADHIAEGVTMLDELARRAGVDVDALGRLLRYLVARGVFAETASGQFGLTDSAQLLSEAHPTRMRARFDLEGAVGRADLAFTGLIEAIRTGKPSYPTVFGRPFWEDLNADPERAASFAAQMATNATRSGIEAAYDWGGVHHVVDVGGGTGALLAQILTAHPHLHGTLLDLAPTNDDARRTFTEAGVADRVDLVTGSFFDALPAGDAHLLCKVLHDWDDENAIAILRRCAEAAGEDGRVVIVELVADGTEDPVEFTHMDLRMLVYMGGRERTFNQFYQIAATAGMTVRKAGDGKWGSTVLECRPEQAR